MLLVPFIDMDVYSLTQFFDRFLNFGKNIPEFDHILLQCSCNKDCMICKVYLQNIANKNIAEKDNYKLDTDIALSFVNDIRHHLTFNNALLRMQILPIVAFVIEPTKEFPYQIEISSKELNLTRAIEFLKGDININDLLNSSPFGFKFNLFIRSVDAQMNKSAYNCEDIDKQQTNEEYQRILNNIQQVNDILSKKTSEVSPVVENTRKTTGNSLEELMKEATQHVNSTIGQIPDTVPMNPDDAPLPKDMEEIIKTRNEASMDATSNILRNALKNGTNPFATENTTASSTTPTDVEDGPEFFDEATPTEEDQKELSNIAHMS